MSDYLAKRADRIRLLLEGADPSYRAGSSACIKELAEFYGIKLKLPRESRGA